MKQAETSMTETLSLKTYDVLSVLTFSCHFSIPELKSNEAKNKNPVRFVHSRNFILQKLENFKGQVTLLLKILVYDGLMPAHSHRHSMMVTTQTLFVHIITLMVHTKLPYLTEKSWIFTHSAITFNCYSSILGYRVWQDCY